MTSTHAFASPPNLVFTADQVAAKWFDGRYYLVKLGDLPAQTQLFLTPEVAEALVASITAAMIARGVPAEVAERAVDMPGVEGAVGHHHGRHHHSGSAQEIAAVMIARLGDAQAEPKAGAR